MPTSATARTPRESSRRRLDAVAEALPAIRPPLVPVGLQLVGHVVAHGPLQQLADQRGGAQISPEQPLDVTELLGLPFARPLLPGLAAPITMLAPLVAGTSRLR